jgi:hypothetical protein
MRSVLHKVPWTEVGHLMLLPMRAHRYSTGLSSSAGTAETPTQLDIATFRVDVIGDQAAAMVLQTKRSLRPGELAAEILRKTTSSGVSRRLLMNSAVSRMKWNSPSPCISLWCDKFCVIAPGFGWLNFR